MMRLQRRLVPRKAKDMGETGPRSSLLPVPLLAWSLPALSPFLSRASQCQGLVPLPCRGRGARGGCGMEKEKQFQTLWRLRCSWEPPSLTSSGHAKPVPELRLGLHPLSSSSEGAEGPHRPLPSRRNLAADPGGHRDPRRHRERAGHRHHVRLHPHAGLQVHLQPLRDGKQHRRGVSAAGSGLSAVSPQQCPHLPWCHQCSGGRQLGGPCSGVG